MVGSLELQPRTVEMRILLILDRRPSSAEDLATELNLSPAVVSMYLRRLQNAQIVRVAEERQLGNQLQNVYGLVPGASLSIKSASANSAKMLQFCATLTEDIQQHTDDRANAPRCTAALTIAKIPPANIPELIRRINAFAADLEALEEQDSPTTVTVAMAIYPRVEEPAGGEN